jgi:vacuolar-type H+-ATPase subunit F/Vma7
MTDSVKNWRRVIRRAFCFAFIFFIGLGHAVPSGEDNEYNIKAMFVLNFIKYIEWPNERGASYLRIGVIGKSEMYDALRGMTANRNETKQILIDEVTADSKDSYKIIIISKSENSRIDEVIKRFRSKGVLIISDEYKGNPPAVINLLNINNKIRFEINNAAAHDQGIKISSKLTELALTVYTKNDQK